MIIREMRDLIAYHSKNGNRFAKHDCRNVFEKAIQDLDSIGFGEIKGKQVLDLGCGQRYPFSLQCAASGASVTALDLEYVAPVPFPLAYIRTLHRNGIKRATKSAFRQLIFDGDYYRSLESYAGRNLRAFRSKITFIVADPEKASYPLPSETFNLVASNAVVEHVMDVDKFAFEINRLLKKGGYFYSIIHNFYSLSGGHNLDWAFPDEHPSRVVPVWDHLRENKYPAWVPLNRLKPQEYKEAFAKQLEVVLFEGVDINHDPGGLEGERFLTGGILDELAIYPRELLLTRAWRIICRKP